MVCSLGSCILRRKAIGMTNFYYTFSPNDSLTSATPLSMSTSIGWGNDDYFIFVVPQAETFHWTINSPVNDAGFPGVDVLEDVSNGQFYAATEGMTLASGTYYLDVANADPETISYTITLSTTTGPQP